MNAVTNQEANQVALAGEQYDIAPVASHSISALVLNAQAMDNMYRLAEMMASGRSTIPDHLKGNAGDCMAIVMQSVQWRMNPFAVAQKTFFTSGKIGYEGQLVSAAIISSGVTVDRLHHEWYGDWSKIIGKTKVIQMPAKGDKKAYEYRIPDYSMTDENGLGIRVWATVKGETEPRVLELLLAQASVRNSPLWASDPRQQLAYLADRRWARLNTPDVIMGVYTRDELEEQTGGMKDITPRQQRATPQSIAQAKADVTGPSEELIMKIRNAADNGRNAFDVVWKAITPSERGSLRGEIDDLRERCEKADKKAAATDVDVTEAIQGDQHA